MSADFYPFEGFPKECLQFLQALSQNNNRDWFQAHKSDYEDFVLKPAQGFVAALGEKLKSISSGIQYDERKSNGSILRIYRDVRFSKDKTPYHTYLRMIFWEGNFKKTENPAFFVGIEPSWIGVFVGQYHFPKNFLNTYRQAVFDEEFGRALEQAIEAVKASGAYEIGGQHYKNVPRGYNPDHKRAALLKHNGLFASIGSIAPTAIQSPEFVDICFAHCQNMAPIQKWLVSVAAHNQR